MDDLLFYSSSLEQHLRDVREVLSILRQEKLYVKASKCAFGRQELGFLGHRVSAAGVSVDPRKVSAVRDWPTPASNVELRRFVGLCNYYRRFYADITFRKRAGVGRTPRGVGGRPSSRASTPSKRP